MRFGVCENYELWRLAQHVKPARKLTMTWASALRRARPRTPSSRCELPE